MDLCTGRLPKDELYCSALPQMADFSPSLPDPQKYWSVTDLVQQICHKSIPQLYPIDGNDRWGDCTVAAASHMITIDSALAGNTVIPSAQDVIALYSRLGNGADNGLPLSTVLKAWQKGILGGHTIQASCNVDSTNLTHVKQAIQFLGGVYIGFNTTSDTFSQFQAGTPWTVTNGRTRGGHCVVVTGFNDMLQELTCLTWGQEQRATYDWFNRYVDECHAIVTTANTAFSSTTVADMKARMPSLGGA